MIHVYERKFIVQGRGRGRARGGGQRHHPHQGPHQDPLLSPVSDMRSMLSGFCFRLLAFLQKCMTKNAFTVNI